MKAEIGRQVAISNMTTTERVEHSIQQDDDFKKQVKRTNILLLIIMAALVGGPALFGWWAARQIPAVQTVSMDNVRIVGPSALCVGDPLVYAYSFHAEGAGILVRDRVLWRLTPPPKTLIYSQARRFILTEAIDQELTETWHVPENFLNPETDAEEPLLPGDYRLIFSVSSPSRSSIITIARVDFEILENCS